MKDVVKNDLFETTPHHNEITTETFSYWPVLVARIKKFNGVKNDIYTMAVYAHLLGWKKTTGNIRPSQQYIADCCGMGLSTVQKTVKKLADMGWITATPIRRDGSKEILYVDYTVKDPDAILSELNIALNTVKEERQNEQPSKPCAGVADIKPIKKPVQQHRDVSSDPVPECPDGVDVVPVILNKRDVTAGIQTLETWINGYDEAGFFEYGKRYGLTKTREIAAIRCSEVGS